MSLKRARCLPDENGDYGDAPEHPYDPHSDLHWLLTTDEPEPLLFVARVDRFDPDPRAGDYHQWARSGTGAVCEECGAAAPAGCTVTAVLS